ncbi:MAG: uracil-DNA glycosylase [Magnetococcales bacterium]|nr:uracil-DNA glycosylase [Magnetococcales bacterium]
MDTRSALLATLRYWRACGIDRLTGEAWGWHQPALKLPAAPVTRLSVPVVPEVVPVLPTPTVEPAPVSLDRLLTPALPLEARLTLLAERAERVAGCQACALALTRRRVVYGVGPADAVVVWIVDAPGEADESKGMAFAGEGRELFEGMLRGVGLERHEVYVTHLVKCRPPGDRAPRGDEVRLCQGYWIEELETIRPKAIVALGKAVVETLLGDVGRLTKARGQVHVWRGIPVIATYHPSYCLRAPLSKRALWEDVLLLKKRLMEIG